MWAAAQKKNRSVIRKVNKVHGWAKHIFLVLYGANLVRISAGSPGPDEILNM